MAGRIGRLYNGALYVAVARNRRPPERRFALLPPAHMTMRLTRITALACAAVVSSGCYHAVVETGRPAGGTIVSRPWTPTYLWGLVAAPEINVASQCPRGIAKVDTEMSFVNGLAALVTLGIYTPRTVTVTCASGSASAGARVIEVASTDLHSRLAAMNAATEASVRTGEPVFVRF